MLRCSDEAPISSSSGLRGFRLSTLDELTRGTLTELCQFVCSIVYGLLEERSCLTRRGMYKGGTQRTIIASARKTPTSLHGLWYERGAGN